MTAEQIARESCAEVFEAVRADLAGPEYVARIEAEFSAGVEGITLAASGEPLSIDMFASGSRRSLGKVAGYDAFFTEAACMKGLAA